MRRALQALLINHLGITVSFKAIGFGWVKRGRYVADLLESGGLITQLDALDCHRVFVDVVVVVLFCVEMLEPGRLRLVTGLEDALTIFIF